MFCDGGLRSGEHCCWIDGAPCRFLEEWTVSGRRWACGLMRELGSWDAVHADSGYVEFVQPTYDRLFPGYGCGDYPQGIPEVMGNPDAGKCCWEAVTDG
jgi:hypothetical protein